MSTLDLQPVFLSKQESKEVASKQLLSFLAVPVAEAEAERELMTADPGLASSKSLFSIDALPHEAFVEGPLLSVWKSRKIYDVDGVLLFRDQIINLGSGNELRVRTAASDLLRTPVWSVKAGPALDVEGLMAGALAALQKTPDLEPLLVDGEEDVRIVCYSYPKLGILCYSRADPSAGFVIDIGDLIIIPLDASRQKEHPQSVFTVWSPYDLVAASTIEEFRSLWKHNVTQLPALPETVEALSKTIKEAKPLVPEETIPKLKLVGQQTDAFCVPAVAKMILEQHGICKTQNEIAIAMKTDLCGTTLPNEVEAIPGLTGGVLRAVPDLTASFDEAKKEIRQNRPLKVGTPGHARACDGFKVEDKEGGKSFIHIYDPWPPGQGEIYDECREGITYTDHVYVRP